MAGFTPGYGLRAAPASPGELHGLRQDPRPAERGVWLSRRADSASVIGSALLAKATGAGHRLIAAALGRPTCTVRGWLRRFSACAEQVRVFFTRLLHSLDPQAGPILPQDCVFADALEALGRASAAGIRRLSPRPPWEFASGASGGWLLAPGGGR